MEEVIKQACRALCHWLSYNSIILPDYHINEGAVMWEYAKLLRSIDRTNDLKISLEKAYSQIKLDVNLKAFWGVSLDNRAADIVVSNGGSRFVFEVKKDQNKSAEQGRSIPPGLKKDLLKLKAFKYGILSKKIRCYLIYLTQGSYPNRILMKNMEDKITLDKLRVLAGEKLNVNVISVSRSISDHEEHGDYCYLLEVVPR